LFFLPVNVQDGSDDVMATEGMALGPANETTVESSNKQRSPYSGTESTKDQWVPEILGDDFPC